MRLHQIAFTRFKGGDDSVELSGLDIFTGPNGIGKTRIMQAIQLALAGYVPNHNDDKNIDLIDLFTKRADINTMIVAADFNGFSIERKFESVRKGESDSLSQSISLIPFAKLKGVKECESQIQESIGSFPYMLNVLDFVRLSDEKRFELLFSLCPVDVKLFTLQSVQERLKNTAKPLLPETATDNPEALKVMNDLGKFVSDNLQGSMINALEWLKKKQSDYKKAEKNFSSATVGAVNLDQQSGKQSLRHIETIQADIEEAHKQDRQLVKDIADATATADAVKRLEDDKRDLNRQIEQAKEQTGVGRIDTLKKQIQDARGKIQDTSTLKEEIAGVEKNISELEQEGTEIKAGMHGLRQGIGRLQKEQQGFADGLCPTCGQEASGMISNISSELSTMEAELKEHEQASQKVWDKIVEAKGVLKSKQEKLSKMEADNKGYETLATDFERQVSNLEGKASSITTLETRLNELNLKRIEGTSLNTAEAQLQLDGIRNRLKKLEDEFKQKVEYDQKIRLMKESSLKAKQNKELLDLTKALIAEVQAIRREMVQSALQPVRQEAAELLATIGIEASFDFQFTDQRGNEVFKFGWKVSELFGPMFVDFDSLSTAQQMFTLVSLLAPLIQRGNPKLRMLLLDNCEVVHEQYREAFVKLLCKAHGRFLDNIVLASSADYPEPTADTRYTLHRLGREVAA